MNRATRIVRSLAVALCFLPAIAGCTGNSEPTIISKTTLGTVVSVSVYGDETVASSAAEDAFSAMDGVSEVLDAYTSGTPIAAFNQDPYTEQALPAEAIQILDVIDGLGVSEAFSPTILGVSSLYGFESSQTVPTDGDLTLAVAASRGFVRAGSGALFARVKDPDLRLEPGGPLAPGLDFGGAAKGLGLDRAVHALTTAGAHDAIVSAGSGTVTLGAKPGGDPWRIGIEDPRDPETIVAVVEADGACSVATSGDYQRYFEAGGVRYHHIIDPATGEPSRGLRSLTVFAPYSAMGGLGADILSTALFVMGPDAAESYATEHGLGLYLVDSEGRARIVPAPADSGVRLVEETEPAR